MYYATEAIEKIKEILDQCPFDIKDQMSEIAESTGHYIIDVDDYDELEDYTRDIMTKYPRNKDVVKVFDIVTTKIL